jgi:hypothetical protein
MYTERLSEQLTAADFTSQVTTTSGATTITGTDIDGIEYNRLIAYGLLDVAKTSTGVSWTIQWQASTATTFGTPTTVTTCSGTFADAAFVAAAVDTVVSCEVTGEQVQSSRVAEDRYVRAILTGTVASATVLGASQLVLADAKRYHPN